MRRRSGEGYFKFGGGGFLGFQLVEEEGAEGAYVSYGGGAHLSSETRSKNECVCFFVCFLLSSFVLVAE